MTIIAYLLILVSMLAVFHALFWFDWALKEPTNGELKTLEKIEKYLF